MLERPGKHPRWRVPGACSPQAPCGVEKPLFCLHFFAKQGLLHALVQNVPAKHGPPRGWDARSLKVANRRRGWILIQTHGGDPEVARSRRDRNPAFLSDRFQWNGLTVFLRNPLVPLDNNPIERQMRDMVLGCKNHYGSKSQRGTEVAALFYSLIETAKLRGEDPGDYLLRAALAAIENPGTVTLPNSFD